MGPMNRTTGHGRGILGGTFDPVHRGHVELARAVRRILGLSEVLLVPCALPPHKPPEAVTEARHRLAMVELAVQDVEGLAVSDIEVRRGGPSYTVDTLRQLAGPGAGKERLVLILGADAVSTLQDWKDPLAILDLAELAILPRGERGLPGLEQFERALGKEVADRVRAGVISVPVLPVSSTDVRARIEAGVSIADLVPENVARYIRQHGLYRRPS
jgi:nicotinate-nucleotide adenylyltransferase